MTSEQRRLVDIDFNLAGRHPNAVAIDAQARVKFAASVINPIEARLNIADARVSRISNILEDRLENRLIAAQVSHAT